MNRTHIVIIVTIALSLIVAGCGSTETNPELQAAFNNHHQTFQAWDNAIENDYTELATLKQTFEEEDEISDETLTALAAELEVYIADLDQFIADLEAFEAFTTENAADLQKYNIMSDTDGLLGNLADARSKIMQDQENHQKLLDMVNSFM